MKQIVFRVLISLFLLLPFSVQSKVHTCTMKYTLTGWSVFYETYKGNGFVRCSNGQSASVSLTLHGGGLTLGTLDIENAKGKFTGVKSIKDIYGTHFSLGVHAGFARSAAARAIFRKHVAGGGAGVGGGYNLGFSFSGLTIKP